MRFEEALNGYIHQIGITAKDLADASGLSTAVISRYRSGERTPAPDCEPLLNLSKGLARLAQRKGMDGFTQPELLSALQKSLRYDEKEGNRLAVNFDLLINVLNLRSSDMARALNFDPSYLSRIRTGQRTPANSAAFAQGVGNFAARRCAEPSERAALAHLMGVQQGALSEDGACACEVAKWLLSGAASQKNPIISFLEKLDNFDLNDYIRAIRFDELKVPTVPFQLPTTRTCYGLENFRQATLDFLKATALSRSREPVFICSDMPIEELAQDMEFSKKWMLGLAAILKKGLRLDMVHDLNRPFGEMMLGLESWIPLYMTGQIMPWYLPGRQNAVYGHLLFCSGAVAVEGECISGNFAHGRYLFSKSGSDLAYYRRRAEAILKKAQPLMDIYCGTAENVYGSFLAAEALKPGKRRSLLTTLPTHTLSEECLSRLLEKNGVPDSDGRRMLEACAQMKGFVAAMLDNGSYEEEFPVLTQKEFGQESVSVAMSEVFAGMPVHYDEADYWEHLRLTRAFAQSHPGYTARENGRGAFRNIQIFISEGKWVSISKCRKPTIHFVIHHPKLCVAIENMIVPLNVQEAGESRNPDR